MVRIEKAIQLLSMPERVETEQHRIPKRAPFRLDWIHETSTDYADAAWAGWHSENDSLLDKNNNRDNSICGGSWHSLDRIGPSVSVRVSSSGLVCSLSSSCTWRGCYSGRAHRRRWMRAWTRWTDRCCRDEPVGWICSGRTDSRRISWGGLWRSWWCTWRGGVWEARRVCGERRDGMLWWLRLRNRDRHLRLSYLRCLRRSLLGFF